jgi:hypothetical protein
MGPRHLDEQISLVCGHGPAGPDEGHLAHLWRQAVAEYDRLSRAEAGAADNPGLKPLSRAAQVHADAVLDSPAVRQTFSTVRVHICLVELGRLVVSQYSVTQQNIDRLNSGWRGRPSPIQLARICLPNHGGDAPFKLAFADERRFEFVSDAHDMRFIGARVLMPHQIPQLAVRGHAQAVVALAVGFSVNVLNVVYFNRRMVLNNGHHRAYALWKAGVTHVPCLVQACETAEEMQQAGTHEVVDNADLYFESPRPPLLRDFDNPLLAHAFEVPRKQRRVSLTVEAHSRLATF